MVYILYTYTHMGTLSSKDGNRHNHSPCSRGCLRVETVSVSFRAQVTNAESTGKTVSKHVDSTFSCRYLQACVRLRDCPFHPHTTMSY